MGLEKDVEHAEVQISEQDKKRVRILMYFFRRETHQKEGKAGVYHSLFLINMAITSGAINLRNHKAYASVLSGKIPFYVQKGIISRREYYFSNRKKGYRTKRSFFTKEAFDPVGGVKD